MPHPGSVRLACDYTKMAASSAAAVGCERSEVAERESGGEMIVRKEKVSLSTLNLVGPFQGH